MCAVKNRCSQLADLDVSVNDMLDVAEVECTSQVADVVSRLLLAEVFLCQQIVVQLTTRRILEYEIDVQLLDEEAVHS